MNARREELRIAPLRLRGLRIEESEALECVRRVHDTVWRMRPCSFLFNPQSAIRDPQFLRRGFTFVEVLAAMLFLAIVVPATLEGILIANRAGVMAERKRQAAELADFKLSEMTVGDAWREKPEQEGDFGEEWPGYRWALSAGTWQEDTMQTVRVEVFFKVQEREYSVAASTLAPAQVENQ